MVLAVDRRRKRDGSEIRKCPFSRKLTPLHLARAARMALAAEFAEEGALTAKTGRPGREGAAILRCSGEMLAARFGDFSGDGHGRLIGESLSMPQARPGPASLNWR